jgi:hypothetical protein
MERYRAGARPDPRRRDRILRAIREAPAPSRSSDSPWLEVGRRVVTMRWPFAAAAAVVVLAAGVAIGMRVAERAGLAASAGRGSTAAPAASVVRFEFDAPFASHVALVGDFNGWDPAASPMRLDAHSGRWVTAMRLENGRHVYAFIVDGDRWVPDPDAPLAPESGFGTPGSVVVVEAGEPS